jgi:ABC-type uncharacterized transport system permease subunit
MVLYGVILYYTILYCSYIYSVLLQIIKKMNLQIQNEKSQHSFLNYYHSYYNILLKNLNIHQLFKIIKKYLQNMSMIKIRYYTRNFNLTVYQHFSL